MAIATAIRATQDADRLTMTVMAPYPQNGEFATRNGPQPSTQRTDAASWPPSCEQLPSKPAIVLPLHAPQYTDIREIAIPFRIVEAIANHELIGNGESDVICFYPRL